MQTAQARLRRGAKRNGSSHHNPALSARELSELAFKMPPHDTLWYDFDNDIGDHPGRLI